MHLVGYLHEDYHNARSLEHKVHKKPLLITEPQELIDLVLLKAMM
jgi:hypothetical protein